MNRIETLRFVQNVQRAAIVRDVERVSRQTTIVVACAEPRVRNWRDDELVVTYDRYTKLAHT